MRAIHVDRYQVESALAATGLKSTSHIRVRDRLHQIADLGLQVIVRDDQAANGRSEVTTACCYGVIHSGLEFRGLRVHKAPKFERIAHALPVILKDGDVVELEVQSIGLLRNQIVGAVTL